MSYGAQGVKGFDDNDNDNNDDLIYTVNIQVVCSVRRPNIANRKQTKLLIYICPMPLHVLRGLRGPTSWARQQCKKLLSLGGQ